LPQAQIIVAYATFSTVRVKDEVRNAHGYLKNLTCVTSDFVPYAHELSCAENSSDQ